jgi:type IV pilus assembly protein PilC
MAQFKYDIQDAGGQVVSGVIQAETLSEAAALARAQGGYLINVVPLAGAAGAADWLAKLRKINIEMGPGLKDIMAFTNQLAVMIKAGINIRSAIGGIADQIKSPRFRGIIEQLKADVEAGKPLSDAMARHPKVFSPLYVNMVRASELSGNFSAMLERISQYLAQQCETRSMVRGAMIYPAIIGTLAVVTTVFLLTWVLPKFLPMFAGKEALLPKPTQFLIWLSNALSNYWYVVLAGLGALAWGFFYGIRTNIGREYWDRAKLRIPLFRRMLRALYITRGLHTLGELINAGVPMLETLAITSEVSGNALYRRMWNAVHQAVKQGEKVATPLSQYNLLPASVVQMISAGEESGKLGEVLRDIAEFYAKELRNTIKAVTAMIEPLMIVVMGAIVGFIAMSMILPIFKMSSLLKH